jgi:sec-independent protein translocase protein TatA
MFGISGEHLLVLLVILLIFGPRKLPELGSSLGRAMKGFKDAMAGKDDAPEVMVKAQPQPQQIPAEEIITPVAEAQPVRAPEARV